MDTVFSEWRFWAVVISMAFSFGGLVVVVRRHAKILNGPMDDLKAAVGDLKISAAVIIERLDTHAEDTNILRDDIKAERKEREGGNRRIWEKLGDK